MSWPWLAALVVGSMGFKVLGVTAFGSLVERKFKPIVVLLPPTLFAALIVVMTFEDGGTLTLDARAAGLAVGAFAVWRKAPLLVVVLAAMATAALLRLFA